MNKDNPVWAKFVQWINKFPDGKLPLCESRINQKLDLCHTTIRVYLKRLEQDGFLEIRRVPGKREKELIKLRDVQVDSPWNKFCEAFRKCPIGTEFQSKNHFGEYFGLNLYYTTRYLEKMAELGGLEIEYKAKPKTNQRYLIRRIERIRKVRDLD
jgi:hypothetical protein